MRGMKPTAGCAPLHGERRWGQARRGGGRGEEFLDPAFPGTKMAVVVLPRFIRYTRHSIMKKITISLTAGILLGGGIMYAWSEARLQEADRLPSTWPAALA